MRHTARYVVTKGSRTVSYHRSYTLAAKARRAAGKGAKITDRTKSGVGIAKRGRAFRNNPSNQGDSYQLVARDGSSRAVLASGSMRQVQRAKREFADTGWKLEVRRFPFVSGSATSERRTFPKGSGNKAMRAAMKHVRRRANPSAAGAAIMYIRRVQKDREMPLRAAVQMYIRERPQQAAEVMDVIGYHPSSEPELRALQSAW